MNAIKAPPGGGKMTVGTWIVLGPEREAQPPVSIEAAAIAVVGTGRKHQAREGPLAFFLPVLRQHKFVVFDTVELLEWALESAQDSEAAYRCYQALPESHPEPRITSG